ncbi:PREDICTED: Werner syndrome ATP-dependent helicase [Nanorana parkeri]|uniref:Werner syndrome ATP-dependent helicase n=1 Tax=Nanorana parkeri TaxID=125878 RepID=UPI000854D4D3|nr:PREDICTED: Werner syndrome ATP-dependent helicase [Nanorana parkeri]
MSGEQRKLPDWIAAKRRETTMDYSKKFTWKKNILEDSLPYLEFSGSVYYSNESNDCSYLSECIREKLPEGSAIGFDIEWPPVYIKGKTGKVSLIQVCLSELECYLFHISSMTGFPKGLKRLLENESIKKVGVGIEGDQWKLLSDTDVKLKGFIELTDVANEKLKCKEKWSLNGLVKHLFSKQLLKDNSVRCSSWDRFPLTDEQRLYAASDAYASLLIYQKLENMDESERDLFHVSTEDSAASLEMKSKLKALSQECLDLVDQVPYDFEMCGKTQRAADILAKLSGSLEDVRSVLLESSKAQEDFEELVCKGSPESSNKTGACVSDCEVKPSSKRDDCRQETNYSSVGKRDAHLKGSMDQDFAMTLGITEEEFQLMEAMGEMHNKKDDESIEEYMGIDDEIHHNPGIESDEELESEMLKSVADLENSPEYDTGTKSFSTNSKYLNNAVDDEEDEGIEEEIEEDWDPCLPEPNAEQIACLKTYFGHSSFKPVQWKVIHSVLKERRDNLVVMATGYGKSLCYQFAPVYTSGIGIVICPLISLMEDQVMQLEMSNIPSCFLGSAQSKNVMQDVRAGKIKVIYMTPEFCSSGITMLQDLDNKYGITLIAIDEAHCISEWGHDFRSAYRKLGSLKKMLPTVPIVALTATASPSIREDILKSLNLRNPQVTCTSFDRPNLFLEVGRKTTNIIQDLQKFLIKKPRGSGWEFEGATIVYCPSRKTSEQVTSELCKLSISCGTYHAGMGIKARREVHHRFMRDEIQCVVATVAFGMGINKPDIRQVIHYGAPKEMESYYQEIGRAGRDGLPSSCHVLWAPTDMNFNRHMLSEIQNKHFREYKLKMLAKMEKYLLSSNCRRRIILSHFEDKQLRKASYGIMGTEKCCDNCKTRLKYNLPVKDVEDRVEDFGPQALQLLSAVEALGEKFGTGVPVLFLRGSFSQRLPDRYRCHPLFGRGKSQTEVFWKALARVLITEGYLQESTGHSKFATTCGLTTKSRNWMSKATNESSPTLLLQPNEELCSNKPTAVSLQPRSPVVIQPSPHRTSSKSVTDLQKLSLKGKFSYQEAEKLPKVESSKTSSLGIQQPCKPPEPTISARDLELQTTLYGKLVSARQKIASEKDIPPAVLATNKVLVDMAKMRPTTVENMKKLDGVSEAKAKMLAPLVEVVKEFCLANCLKVDSFSDGKPSSSVRVSKGSVVMSLPESPRITYSLFQEQKLSLQKIADARSISLAAVGMHLWQALKAGYQLDVQRAGLTPAIQKTITNVIKSPPINSGLSSFQAIRSLVAPEIDIYLVRMVITLLEKEGSDDSELKAESSTSKSLQGLASQPVGPSQPKTCLNNSSWIEKKKLVEESKTDVQLALTKLELPKTPAVAPIKLASWNQPLPDEDTEYLFSESQLQTSKRKLPQWFSAPKEHPRMPNLVKKAKTGKKKGLFG